jgi:glycerol-3-phosphate acyltransferase PlsY
LGIIVAGYLLGCFTTGYYLVKWKTGQDIRVLGSGNIGARNVGRMLGKSGFFLTSLGDGLKGLLAVALARWLTHDENCALLALLAAVLGHLWPVQLGFRGGKGIAPSAGGLILFGWHFLLFVLVLAAGYAVFRRTVPAGLTAYVVLPAASWMLSPHEPYVVGFSILAVIILFCHRQNLAEELARVRPVKPDPSAKKL